MFLKRFYNSLRFYSALVSQLILPLLFVLFALIVIVTAPARQDDDQPRAMLIRNSAQTPDNRTTFFAQFGGSLDLSVRGRVVRLSVCLFVAILSVCTSTSVCLFICCNMCLFVPVRVFVCCNMLLGQACRLP